MASNDLELALRIRAAFEGQQALTNLATSFVDINKKVETLMRGLQAISGSAEGAAEEFTYLEETSKKFGLSVLDLADNYVKLSASAKETNLEGEATRKIFEATASTMAVLGGDTITTERAFRALGQIMSKGQVYAEELKGQLAEAIPGALQTMSRGLGISTNEMLRLMEAGQLSADVLLPFATQLEKEYGNLASSSTTFAQAINRIQTEWALLMNRVGDTGAWNAITSVIDLISKNAEVLAGSLGAGLGVALTGLIKVMGGWVIAAKATVVSMGAQTTALGKLSTAIGWTTSANELAAKAAFDKANADKLSAAQSLQSALLAQKQAQLTEERANQAIIAKQREVNATREKLAVITQEQILSDRLASTKAANIAAQEREAIAYDRSVAAHIKLSTAKAEGIAIADREVVAALKAEASSRSSMNLKTLEVVAAKRKVDALRLEVAAIESGATAAQLYATANEKLLVEKEKLNNSNLRLTASEQAYSLALNNINLQQVIGANAALLTSEQKLIQSAIAREASTNAAVIARFNEAKAAERAALIELKSNAATYSSIEAKTELAGVQAALSAELAKGSLADQKIVFELQKKSQVLDHVIISELRYNEAMTQQGLAVNELMAIEARHAASGLKTIDIETKKAYRAYVTAEANLNEARAKQKLAADTVAATEAEIIALSQNSKQSDLLSAAKQRLFEQNIRLIAAQDQLKSSTLGLGLASDKLKSARDRLALSGAYELELSTQSLAQKELSLKQAQSAVAATEQQIIQAERKIAVLRAEGGSAALLATAERELLLAKEAGIIASEKAVIAGEAVTAQIAKETAAKAVADDATKKLAVSQGILSRAWGLLTGPTGMIAMMVAGFAYMAYAFRDQDEATKILTKSTEEYTEALKGMNAEQLESVAISSAKQIKAIDDKIDAYHRQLGVIKDVTDGTYKYVSAEGGLLLTIPRLLSSLSFLGDEEKNRKNILIELAKLENERDILAGKSASGIDELSNKYYELNTANKKYADDLSVIETAIREQVKVIYSAKQANIELKESHGELSKESLDGTRRVGESVEKLNQLELERANRLLLLKGNQESLNSIVNAYSKVTGFSVDAVRAAISGDQQAIDKLDAKSKAIALSVQSLLRLTDEEKALAAQVKLNRSELEKYEKVQLSGVNAKLREAEAIGDLNAIRQAEIERANAQQSVAQQSLALEQTILSDKQKQLAIEEQLYQQNEKGRPKTQERIDKLKLEITAQEGVVAQKQADIVVTDAQAAAAKRANTLVGSALAQQQQALSNTQNELAELQATYERLSASGESITVLNSLLEQMRKKQAEVAQQTDAMRANMIAAFAAVGLSYEEVMTGMDFETRRQIDAFGALGDQANVTSGDLQKAFTNILAKANTIAELDELARTLKSLGANGKVSGDQVAVGLSAIDLKAAELINSLDPVQQSLEKLGIGVPERLEAIAKQNEVLYDVIKKSKAPIDEVDKAFLKYAESQLLAAEHGAKIDAAALKNEASTRGLSTAFAELQRKMAETDPEIAALVEEFDRYNKIVQRTNALNEQQRDVNKQVIESQKGIAEIIGDKNNVAEEEANLADQAVQDTIQRINDLEKEKDAIDGLIKKLIEKQQAEGLNPEETDSLKQYQDESKAKQLLIDKLNEELRLKEKIAEQAAIDAGPLGQAVRLYTEQANEINRKVEAMEKELEITLKLQKESLTDEQQKLSLIEADKEMLVVTKEGLEAELEKAVAEKDVDKQNEIRLKIADNLIKQAEQEVKIAEQKVEVAKELVAMSEAEEAAAIKKAKAYREAAVAQQNLMEAERAKMEASDGLNEEEKEQLANMAARIAGLKSQAISEDAAADAAAAAVEQGKKQIEITKASLEVAKKRVESAKAEKEVLEDQIEAQDKDTESKNKNTQSTKSNTNAKQDAEQAARDLAKALEEQRKADEEAAQAERDRLNAMKEAAEEAQRQVDNLKADLLKETGFDQEADLLAQMLDYQTKREQLAKAIEEAEGQGNKALVDALKQQLILTNQINEAKTKNINDRYAQEQADRELEATQKIADATQQLTDIIDAAAQERLDIEADHLKSIDQLHEQANADRLAKIKQNKLDQKNADAEYGQARKDQEQATNKEIQSLRKDHQQSLAALEKDYQSSVLNEQADLTQSLESVNQESADSVKKLYEDSANSINEINQDIAEELNDVTDNLSKDLVGVTENLSKDLLGVTKDLTQDLNDLTNDLAKDLEEISKNLVSSMEDAAKELDRDFFTSDRDNARKIEELYRDLDRSIADQQRDTQAELLSLEKDRADKITKLRKDAAESARKDNQQINQEELNDKIKSIQEEFSEKKRRTLEESELKIARDRQDAAVKESDLIEDLAYKKQLLQEEYELERIELAQLAEEKRIEAEQAAEEKRLALEQEAEEKRVALEQEAADRRVILEQEAADRKAEIAAEKAQRLQALQEESLVKKQLLAEELKEVQNNLNSQSQLRLAKLAEEYAMNKAATQQQLNDTIAELNRESEEKIAVLSKEHEAKRQLLQAEQTLALRSINDTYQAELLLLNQQTQAELAEAKKKADQSVLLAQENIQTIQQQIEFELALARTKDLQTESQVRLNASMKETLTLTKSISEQMGALASSSLSGLSQQAETLRRTLQDIDKVL